MCSDHLSLSAAKNAKQSHKSNFNFAQQFFKNLFVLLQSIRENLSFRTSKYNNKKQDFKPVSNRRFDFHAIFSDESQRKKVK